MPNRILRDGILTSKDVASVSPMAELFYRCLMSIADDYGRQECDALVLSRLCFPRREGITEEMVEGWLNECSKELLTIYEVKGKKYLEIKEFNQRLRIMKSRYPAPMTVICQTSDGHTSDRRPSDDRQTTDICPPESESEKNLNLNPKGIRKVPALSLREDPLEAACNRIILRHPHPTKMRPDDMVQMLVSWATRPEDAPRIAALLDANHRAICELPDEQGGWNGKPLKYLKPLRDWFTSGKARDPTATAPLTRQPEEQPKEFIG